MTTTFKTMPTFALPRPRGRSSIIAALVVALVAAVLSGCSLLQLGYGQLDAILFRWLDRYVEFDDAQSLRARTALDDALAWHRRTQLPGYAELLARAEAEVGGDTTPERMCKWSDEIRSRLDPILQQLAPAITDVALTLSPAQLASIEKRYAETNDEFRDEHLQKNPQRRRLLQRVAGAELRLLADEREPGCTHALLDLGGAMPGDDDRAGCPERGNGTENMLQ